MENRFMIKKKQNKTEAAVVVGLKPYKRYLFPHGLTYFFFFFNKAVDLRRLRH